MSREADPEVLRALVALDSDPDFQVVVAWLNLRLLAQEQNQRKQRDEVLLRWGQGRAQELEEILKACAEARQNLSRKPRGTA